MAFLKYWSSFTLNWKKQTELKGELVKMVKTYPFVSFVQLFLIENKVRKANHVRDFICFLKLKKQRDNLLFWSLLSLAKKLTARTSVCGSIQSSCERCSRKAALIWAIMASLSFFDSPLNEDLTNIEPSANPMTLPVSLMQYRHLLVVPSPPIST